MTKETYISLNQYQDFMKFLHILAQEMSDGKILVSSTSHPENVVNGTSLLGLFTLDLSKPVKIEYRGANEEEKRRIFEQIRPFIPRV